MVTSAPPSTMVDPISRASISTSAIASPGPAMVRPSITCGHAASDGVAATTIPTGAPSTATEVGTNRSGSTCSTPGSARNCSATDASKGVDVVKGPAVPPATRKRSASNTSTRRSARRLNPSENADSSKVTASTSAMPKPITRNRRRRIRKSGHATIQTNPQFGIFGWPPRSGRHRLWQRWYVSSSGQATSVGERIIAIPRHPSVVADESSALRRSPARTASTKPSAWSSS